MEGFNNPVSETHRLTHWGRVMHICVGNLTIIDSDNGWWPGRHHAIVWPNCDILSIEPIGANFSEMLLEFHTFSFKKMNAFDKIITEMAAILLQCVNNKIVDWTHRNKPEWNVTRISYISFKKMHLTRSSPKWRPFCFNVLIIKTIAAIVIQLYLSKCMASMAQLQQWLHNDCTPAVMPCVTTL